MNDMKNTQPENENEQPQSDIPMPDTPHDDSLEKDDLSAEMARSDDPVASHADDEEDAASFVPDEDDPVMILDDHHDIDVESALAALATLPELTREEDPNDDPDMWQLDEADEQEDLQPFVRAERQPEPDAADDYTPDPVAVPMAASSTPRSELLRGQLASVLPALLLMLSGGVLLFALTTDAFVLSSALLTTFAIAAFGVMLLAYWFSMGRTAAGSFFFGVLLLFSAATYFYLSTPASLPLYQIWPLLLLVVAVAFVLTDLFTPIKQQLWLPGLVVAVAGLAGTVVTMQLLPTLLTDLAQPVLPVALGIILLIMIAPIFSRRRS